MIDINDAWYRVSVKAIIYNNEWKILLCKEDNWMWDFPGWWLDQWENPEECLKREIMEEMWLEVLTISEAPVCFITAQKFRSKTRPWIWNLCYEITVKNLEFTTSDEYTEIWFFNKETFKEIKVFENVEKVFNKLF